MWATIAVMRNCFLLLFLFITAAATGQQHDTSNAPVVLKQLPTEGVLLDKDWKFMAGDNPAYADPQYDDRNWRPIDPTKDIHDLPQLWQGIAWFRLHFMVDSAIARSIAMEIQQSGASEIYLNG